MKISISIEPDHYLITIDEIGRRQMVAFGVEDANGSIEWTASTHGVVPPAVLIEACSKLINGVNECVTEER